MFEVVDTGFAEGDVPVSDTVKAGKQIWTVHISEDPATGEIVPGDIEVQTRQTLENMAMAMKAAGGSLKDIVQVQIYLIDSADAAGMNRVYRQYFSKPYPVRATVVVKELLDPDMRVEMLATAVLG